jgi:purine-nucleoside/S-methyl-5'-thioadenosine phosphorylase / adenosine deaminase
MTEGERVEAGGSGRERTGAGGEQAGPRSRGASSRPLPPAPAELTETPIPGSVPRYEIPGWRERFAVVAGITGRGSGSGPGFDLGLWTREPVSEVMGRWRDFRAAEPGFAGFVLGHQVHGAEISWHEPARGWTIHGGLDGHLTTAPGTMLLVTVADCIPVYLLVPKRRAVGLLHAGWRGTAAGILARGMDRLASYLAVSPADIVVHCGIGICGSCYEVGSEVLQACGAPDDERASGRLDLRAVLARQATDAGAGTVTVSTWCTAHDRAAFFSHRASGGADGRMVAYAGYPAG